MTETDTLSFLPDDYKHRRVRQRTAAAGAGAILLVVVAMGSNIFIAERALQQTERAHAAVGIAYNDATQRIDGCQRQRREQRGLVQNALLGASLTDDVPRSTILAELTNALPVGTSLIELNLESRPHVEAAAGNTAFDMKKAALESQRKAEYLGFSEALPQDVIVNVSGLAETDVQVAQYLAKLAHSPLFHDVKLLISETSAQPGNAAALRRFQIRMKVHGSATLHAEARIATVEP